MECIKEEKEILRKKNETIDGRKAREKMKLERKTGKRRKG